MWAAVTEACLWLGAAVLTSLLGWLAAVAFSKMRPLNLIDRPHTRAVLITGCDSGFGHGLARRLDTLGVPVFAGCLFPDGSGARSLAKDCSSRLQVLPLDVTSDQQVADAVVSVKAELSAAPDTELWAVVNNAGIGDVCSIHFMPVGKFQQLLDVNTVGPIRVTKAFLPLLIKSRGRVINVTSPLGRIPVPLLAAYCLSKSALATFSDVLRMEMKKWSVTVCTIDPTMYRTSIINEDGLKAKFAENMKRTVSDVGGEQEERQHFEKILLWMKWLTKEDTSEVVDEMVIACVGRKVQRRHLANFKDAIIYTGFPKFPDWLRDFVIELHISVVNIIWKLKRSWYDTGVQNEP